MALIHNNLLINRNSQRYAPFLLNLITGRRRLLNNAELKSVCSMMSMQNVDMYDMGDLHLYERLRAEKQFVDDKERAEIEKGMLDAGLFDIDTNISDDLSFTAHLTWDCNMKCTYCYANSYVGKKDILKPEHVDSIYNFFAILLTRSP